MCVAFLTAGDQTWKGLLRLLRLIRQTPDMILQKVSASERLLVILLNGDHCAENSRIAQNSHGDFGSTYHSLDIINDFATRQRRGGWMYLYVAILFVQIMQMQQRLQSLLPSLANANQETARVRNTGSACSLYGGQPDFWLLQKLLGFKRRLSGTTSNLRKCNVICKVKSLHL